MDNISYNEPPPLLLPKTPSDDLTILSDTNLSCILPPSSTDESLRMTIDSHDENADLDSELFIAQLENFINTNNNQKVTLTFRIPILGALSLSYLFLSRPYSSLTSHITLLWAVNF